MALLGAEEVFGAPDLAIEEVSVPEWKDKDGNPGIIRFRELDAAESVVFTDQMEKAERKRDGMFIIIALCACDEKGQSIFTLDDIPKLRKKNFKVLDRLQRVALRLNGYAVRGSEDALKKASGEAAPAASPIASPENSGSPT